MNQKEILHHIIVTNAKGCEDIHCIDVCPVFFNCGFNMTTIGRKEIVVELFLRRYGREELMEILL